MPFKLYIYLGAFATYCDPILVKSIMTFLRKKPKFDHLLELSHRDDSNKRSNLVFGKITQVELIEVNSMVLIK